MCEYRPKFVQIGVEFGNRSTAAAVRSVPAISARTLGFWKVRWNRRRALALLAFSGSERNVSVTGAVRI
jgi:hypothetical protein